MTALADLMAKIEDRAFFARVGAPLGLHLAGDLERAPSFAPPRVGAGEHALLAREGFLRIAHAAPSPSSIARAIEALAAEGVPPLFVYVFDEVWAIGAAVAAAVAEAASARYEILDDAWAFLVPAIAGRAGWAAHRGVYEPLDRAAPEVLNAWVALTDVTPDNACMYLVPLDADPSYPGDLASTSAPLEAARAVPAAAGEALVWNANVLHWSGRTSARAATPRVSVTFTLRRAGSEAGGPATPVDGATLGHRERLDLVASQIATYADVAGDVDPAAIEWANMMISLRRPCVRSNRGER